MPSLRLHALLPRSRANGPGVRAVLWTQGCSLGCPGCFNPATHPFQGGVNWKIDDLLGWLHGAAPIDGITLTGGEPLQQAAGVVQLLRRVRTETSWSVILFTGYSLEETRCLPRAEEVLDAIDVLIAGRFEQDQHLGRGLRGSANKTVHLLTPRYTLAELDTVPPVEVLIGTDGTIALSGIHPLRSGSHD